MSWSVVGMGKARALAAKLEGDFARSKCAEPEETVKNLVASAVAKALAAFPPDHVVRVEASGSQLQPDHAKQEFNNNLKVEIAPVWGFVE